MGGRGRRAVSHDAGPGTALAPSFSYRSPLVSGVKQGVPMISHASTSASSRVWVDVFRRPFFFSASSFRMLGPVNSRIVA